MSYVISEKQHLATSESRSQYKPFRINDKKCKAYPLDINFGHPLYTSVCDIFAIRCNVSHPILLPVIPDGCMTMAFFGKEEEMKGRICGAIDEIKKIRLNPGELLLMMRFQPSATVSILRTSANSLINKVYDINDSIKNGSQIISAANRDMPIQDKSMLLSKLIRIRMKEDDASYLVKYCTDRIFEKDGNIKVRDLGIETGYSERYLGKVFEKYVGLSPKTYCEIIRLQNSLNKLVCAPAQEPLMRLAVDSGFFDHAHMNRCYRKFLHCSSGYLRKHGFACLDYEKIEQYLYIN